MQALLEHIRPMLAAAEARVQTLQEMERLALHLGSGVHPGNAGAGDDTGPAPEPAAARPGMPAAGVVPRPETEARDGSTSAGVAEGSETVASHGLLPVATEQTPPTPSSSASGSGPSTNGHAPRTSTRARILAYVTANGQVKRADIATALGVDVSSVATPLQDLVRDGVLDADGSTRSRVYFTKEHGDQAAAAKAHAKQTGASQPLAALNADIEAVIRETLGGLNEPDIADSLGLDREDVAVACGELLHARAIQLRPDGTYVSRRSRDVTA